ncbi:MAG: type VI secretion system-associated FHA domain protein TagH [Casimicrobiaceae bacterium]
MLTFEPLSMLTITVLSYNDIAVTEPIRAQFDEKGGTVGRSPDSTLQLPDPERIISRTHALILLQEGRYLVRDQGTTVPVIVNGRPVGRGRDHPLAMGDELRIAGYTLRVEVLLNVHADIDVSAEDTTTILREGTMLSWAENGTAAHDNLIATVIVPSPEEDAGTSAPAAPAPSAAAAPRAAPPAALPVATAAAAAPASADAATDVLVAELLRGAGVHDLEIPGGLTPQVMEELGAVMRETMRGLLDLLVARAQAKREVRADATIIVANDNNPLKFAPSLDAAIHHLLMPRGQGFMTPLRSLTDARMSLRSHQEGFVAGMRAALAAVLARFDPAKLEQRLTRSAAGGSLLPMNHKAKLWDLYAQLYGEISREAETDFHFLFGEEFLRAYQAKARPLPNLSTGNDAP